MIGRFADFSTHQLRMRSERVARDGGHPMNSTRWLSVAILATACKDNTSDSSGGDTQAETFSISGVVMDMGVPPLGTAAFVRSVPLINIF